MNREGAKNTKKERRSQENLAQPHKEMVLLILNCFLNRNFQMGVVFDWTRKSKSLNYAFEHELVSVRFNGLGLLAQNLSSGRTQPQMQDLSLPA
jgi:hypothetical protein